MTEQTAEWQFFLIHVNFVDFEKAFDSIYREELWDAIKAHQYCYFECAILDD